MRKIVTLAVAAALSLGISAAYASQSEGGFSIGVKGGYNDMDVPTDAGTFGAYTVTPKKDKYLADIHADYLWPVADVFQLGGQVGYSYYGKYKLTSNNGSASSKISALNLQLVGQWNIQQFFVQARVGEGYFHSSNSNSISDTSYDIKNTWAPVAGLSAGYFFTDNFSAEISYDHTFGKNYSSAADLDRNNNKVPTMNSVGVGLTYSF